MTRPASAPPVGAGRFQSSERYGETVKHFLQKYKYPLISVCSFLFVLLVWELITDVFHVINPMMLPSPAKIFETLVYKPVSYTHLQPGGDDGGQVLCPGRPP